MEKRNSHLSRLIAAVTAALAVAALAAATVFGGESLSVSVPSTQLPLDRVGEVRDEGGRFEVRDRQYEGEFGSFPVTINGVDHLADEIKVISDLKVQDGVGEHRGTIDIDIDRIPGGHITLEYRGEASVDGSSITSGGEFRIIKATDTFDGIRAEGTYSMTIVESGDTLGSPAIVTISAHAE